MPFIKLLFRGNGRCYCTLAPKSLWLPLKHKEMLSHPYIQKLFHSDVKLLYTRTIYIYINYIYMVALGIEDLAWFIKRMFQCYFSFDVLITPNFLLLAANCNQNKSKYIRLDYQSALAQ